MNCGGGLRSRIDYGLYVFLYHSAFNNVLTYVQNSDVFHFMKKKVVTVDEILRHFIRENRGKIEFRSILMNSVEENTTRRARKF